MDSSSSAMEQRRRANQPKRKKPRTIPKGRRPPRQATKNTKKSKQATRGESVEMTDVVSSDANDETTELGEEAQGATDETAFREATTYAEAHSPKELAEQFWPNIKSHLVTPDPSIKLKLQCVICHAPLTVCGVPIPDSFPSDVTTERCAILHCGHIVGLECLRQWHYHQWLYKIKTLCPVCNECLVCDECGQPFPEVLAPESPEDTRSWPPATVPEGAAFSRKCADCSAKNAFALRRLQKKPLAFDGRIEDVDPNFLDYVYEVIDYHELQRPEPGFRVPLGLVQDTLNGYLTDHWDNLRDAREDFLDWMRLNIRAMYPWN
jgi:hypothetical protein